MEPLVLYCKSYARDILRVKRLLDSIERYNRERLPVFISMPSADHLLFNNKLGSERCIFIPDEEIAAASLNYSPGMLERLPGRITQQILKAEFWRLGAITNYLCIDSDSYFITNFGVANFLHSDGDPYTVIHQNKELLQMAANRGINKVRLGFEAECNRFFCLFDRPGPQYAFMPSPFLWSAKVWRSLFDNYLMPRRQSLWEVITNDLPESMWYGETLLAYGAIPLRPVEPYFRVYHYDWQYFILRRQGETEATLQTNYLGIVYQSNWNFDLDYGAPQKSFISRFLRRIKRSARKLQAWL